LVSGTKMGSGCALSALMGSTPPVTGSTSLVTSETDAVPISNLGLPVVAIAEVIARTLNVSATSVTIPMTPGRAKADAMTISVLGSPMVSIVKVLVASIGSVEASSKADQKSFPVKGLLRRGFLGLSPASSLSVLVAKEVCPAQLDTSPFLTAGSSVSSYGAIEMGTRLCLSHPGMTDSGTPIYSSISKSQKGYSQRVKNNIGKQPIKNKNLLAFVADTPVVEEEGYSERVLDAMELAPPWV
jgi:hypothetical protein